MSSRACGRAGRRGISRGHSPSMGGSLSTSEDSLDIKAQREPSLAGSRLRSEFTKTQSRDVNSGDPSPAHPPHARDDLLSDSPRAPCPPPTSYHVSTPGKGCCTALHQSLRSLRPSPLPLSPLRGARGSAFDSTALPLRPLRARRLPASGHLRAARDLPAASRSCP